MAKQINTSHINTNDSYISPNSLRLQGLWNIDIQDSTRKGVMYLNEEAQKTKLGSVNIDSDYDYSYDSSTNLEDIPVPFIWSIFKIGVSTQNTLPYEYNILNLSVSMGSVIRTNFSTDLFSISFEISNEQKERFSQSLFSISCINETEQEEDLLDIGLAYNKRADQNKETGEEFNTVNYSISWIIRSPGGTLGWFNDPIGLFIISSVYTSSAMTGRTKDYEIQIGIEGCIGFDVATCFPGKHEITFPIPLTVTPSNEDRDNSYYGTSVIEQIIGGEGTLLTEWGADDELYWSQIAPLVPESYINQSISYPSEIISESNGIKIYNHGGIKFAYVLASTILPSAPYLTYYFSFRKRIPVEISTKSFITEQDDTSDTWALIQTKAIDPVLGKGVRYSELKSALLSIIRSNNP